MANRFGAKNAKHMPAVFVMGYFRELMIKFSPKPQRYG